MSETNGDVEGPVFEGRLHEDPEVAGELVEGPVFEGRLDE